MRLKSIEVLAIKKGADTYAFIFDSARRGEITRTFGRFAANPELNFDWADAARLTKRIVATSHTVLRKDAT